MSKRTYSIINTENTENFNKKFKTDNDTINIFTNKFFFQDINTMNLDGMDKNLASSNQILTISDSDEIMEDNISINKPSDTIVIDKMTERIDGLQSIKQDIKSYIQNSVEFREQVSWNLCVKELQKKITLLEAEIRELKYLCNQQSNGSARNELRKPERWESYIN